MRKTMANCRRLRLGDTMHGARLNRSHGSVYGYEDIDPGVGMDTPLLNELAIGGHQRKRLSGGWRNRPR
jgi:hypothetical protein